MHTPSWYTVLISWLFFCLVFQINVYMLFPYKHTNKMQLNGQPRWWPTHSAQYIFNANIKVYKLATLLCSSVLLVLLFSWLAIHSFHLFRHWLDNPFVFSPKNTILPPYFTVLPFLRSSPALTTSPLPL